MAQVKVSDLPAASGLGTSDPVIVNQSGVTTRTTAGAFTDTMTGFTPAGTGAVAETVRTALRHFVHTAQYGTNAQYLTALNALAGTLGINLLEIAGYITGRTLSGSSDGFLLKIVNPLDGTTRDLIQAGPEQDFLIGPANAPYGINFRQPINAESRQFVDCWDHKQAAFSAYDTTTVSYTVEDLGVGADITARGFFKAGAAIRVLLCTAIQEANSAGIGASPNDATITLRNITQGNDVATINLVADVVANAATDVPVSIANDNIAASDVLGVVVSQLGTADLGKFTLQFDYRRETLIDGDPNWIEVESGLTDVTYTEASARNVRLTVRSNNQDTKIIYRNGWIVQGSGHWVLRTAFAEDRDTGNTDPGNKTIAYGYTDTQTDPLAVTSKTICLYRTNNDGTGFGTWQIRVIDGAAATDTALDDVSVKTGGPYGEFHIHHLEYVPTAGKAYAWIGNSSNYFNKDNSATADAEATVSAGAFTAGVLMKPFFLTRVEQASGTVGFLYTTIKTIAGVRWHF